MHVDRSGSPRRPPAGGAAAGPPSEAPPPHEARRSWARLNPFTWLTDGPPMPPKPGPYHGLSAALLRQVERALEVDSRQPQRYFTLADRALSGSHRGADGPLFEAVHTAMGGWGSRRQCAEPPRFEEAHTVWARNQVWLAEGPLQASHVRLGAPERGHFLMMRSPLGMSTTDYLELFWQHDARTAMVLNVDHRWSAAGMADFVHNEGISLHLLQVHEVQVPVAREADAVLEGAKTPPGVAGAPRPGEARFAYVAGSTLRMELRRGAARRPLQLCLFAGWPDFEAPHPATLGALHAWLDQAYSAGPVVVHCMAGRGRSGTFVACDGVARRLRDRADVTFAEATAAAREAFLQVRLQRPGAVETADQFIAILRVALQAAGLVPPGAVLRLPLPEPAPPALERP